MTKTAKWQSTVFPKLIAIAIAAIAQALVNKHWIISIILWLVSIGLFLFSIRKSQNNPLPNFLINPIEIETHTRWTIVLAALALAACGVSFFLFTTKLPNLAAWILHGLSLVLAVLAVTVFTKNQTRRPSHERWHWGEILGLSLVLGLAAFVRFYRLNQLPYGFWYDEADNGLNALMLLNGTNDFAVYAQSTHLPSHLLYLIAFAIKVFGQNMFAVRVVAALFGVGTVAAGFLTGRELFNRRTGILLAFFLSVCRWDLVWSRLGMHGVSVPFFELLSFGLLLRALRLQRYRDYLFAGFSLGLGLCFYVPLRLFPLIALLLLALVWITHPDFIKKSYKHILVLILGAFMISVPVSQFALFHSEEFWGRTNTVSVFNDKTFKEGMQTVLKTSGQHLLMFNYQGDRNGRHNIPDEPMLDTFTAGLFVLGIGICLRRIKQPSSIFILCWLLIMLLPGILSLDFEAPQSLRAIGSLPAACLLACLPLHALLEDQEITCGKEKNLAVIVSMVLILFFIGSSNIYNYFVREAHNPDAWASHSTNETIIAHEMVNYGDQVDYYVSTFYFGTPTLFYLAPDVTNYHKIETHATLPVVMDGSRDAIFFLDPDRTPVYDQLKKFYPNAVFLEHKKPNGSLSLYEVYLTRADILALQGISVSYFNSADSAGDAVKTETLSQMDITWNQQDAGSTSTNAEFSGVLFADPYGFYQMQLEAPAEASLYLDGDLVLQTDGSSASKKVELARGVHSIVIKAGVAAGELKVSWQPPEGEMTAIPNANLFLPPVTSNGLLGRYYANANWEGDPAYLQVDPFIHFYFHNPPLSRPYTVEWTGRIKIDQAGAYEFGTESIDGSQLYIDGQLIVDNQIGNEYQGSSLELSEGFHTIKLRFSDLTGHTHVNLFWTPPDGIRDYIPSDVLFIN